MKFRPAWVVLGLVLSLSGGAAAQEEEPAIDDESVPADGEIAESDETTAGPEAATAPDGPPEMDEAESAGSRAWSFGPYVRFVVVPSFMLNLFLDLAPSPANLGFGATAVYRVSDDGPSFEFGIGYTSYAFSGPFRSMDGEPGETEWVESDLGLVGLTGAILWEAKLAEPLSFQYGIGLDFGVVTGSMVRTEAYQTANGGYAKCTGPDVPPGLYCLPPLTGFGLATDPADKDGEQYNVTHEGIPPVFGLPMLPQIALRYTPIPEVVLRLQAAYGIAQFWFGLAAAYAPEL